MSALNLSSLVDEAFSVKSGTFIEILDKAMFLLQNEKGQIGNLTIINRLVKLEPLGEALVIGDLHGDFESLLIILRESQFVEKMEKNQEATLIFLGDYGDRGPNSAEIYYAVLKLKLAFPMQVVLLRGNHEAPIDLLGEPHDLPIQFQERFGEKWKMAYIKTRALFADLYNAVWVEGRYLMVHGGLSPQIRSLQDIAQAKENHSRDVLEDLLWSDPDENVEDIASSPRGAGHLFGEKVTKQVLANINAKILIRGHESSDLGYKINHDGGVLTLFSRKGSPYFNRHGAYLELQLPEKIENANQLTQRIHQF